MNPVGFGRHAEVLVHTPLPPHVQAHTTSTKPPNEASQQQHNTDNNSSHAEHGRPTSTNNSRLGSLFSAFKPSYWRRGGGGSHEPSAQSAAAPTASAFATDAQKKIVNHHAADHHAAKPMEFPPLTLDHLQATEIISSTSSQHNDSGSGEATTTETHLLTFDILRFAVFAVTETVYVNNSNTSSSTQRPSPPPRYVFSPEVLPESSAHSIMESQLHSQVHERLKNIADAANAKLTSSTKAAATQIAVQQTQNEAVVDMSTISGKVNSGNASPSNNNNDNTSGGVGEVVINMTSASPSSPDMASHEKLRAYQKVKVSQWVRKERSAATATATTTTHELIRMSSGPSNCVLQNHLASASAEINAYNSANMIPQNSDVVVNTLPDDKYNTKVPYTVHLYGSGVGATGGASADDKHHHHHHSRHHPHHGDEAHRMHGPVVVVSPPAAQLQHNHQQQQQIALPTVSSLADLHRVYAPPIVVKLFREQTATASTNTNSQQQQQQRVVSTVGNIYDNEEDGYEHYTAPMNVASNNTTNGPRDTTSAPAALTDAIDSFGGGAQLLRNRWQDVERAIATAGLSSSQHSHSNENGSDSHHYRPRPSWVDEVVEAITAEIEAKNAVHKQKRTNNVTRINFLCFVPYAVSHPTVTRKLNMIYSPEPSSGTTTAGGGDDGSHQQEVELSSADLRDADIRKVNDAANNKLSSAGNNPNPSSTIDAVPPPHPTLPKALIIPPSSVNNKGNAIPLPITTLDSVMKDTGYVVSIVPKFGS